MTNAVIVVSLVVAAIAAGLGAVPPTPSARSRELAGVALAGIVVALLFFLVPSLGR